MIAFSFPERSNILQRLKTIDYDVLVIGGGITGAGIALDAASRGLKTALVEKIDFAYGTSSRSTKLIHGGLRYLKQLEFGLVKEVGSERAVVHNLAPHLVVPEKMLLPLSEKRGLGYGLTSIGLKIYDWLAGVKPQDQRRMLTKSQTLRQEPLLRKEDVKGGAIYAEYRTDDARLTIEIIKLAVQHGAEIINYVHVDDFMYDNEVVKGARCTDVLTQEQFGIKATVVVNATGPWVDQLREVNHSKKGKRLHLTKGVHIVVANEKLPVTQAIYFDVEDGRMIFAIPRGRTTYIGTTDTNYFDDQDKVGTDKVDAEYLVRAINFTFPSVAITLNDLESSWAGLRPLIHEEGKSASELSRKDEIFESPSGLISIAGGKLTGYRKMAERVVNLIIRKHFSSASLKACHTQKLKLAQSDFVDYAAVKKYIGDVDRRLRPVGFTFRTAQYLVENYGQQTDQVLAHQQKYSGVNDKDIALARAEFLFGCQHEMICGLADFFVRRTGMLYFDLPRLMRCRQAITADAKLFFNWSDNRVQQEVNALDLLILAATSFKT